MTGLTGVISPSGVYADCKERREGSWSRRLRDVWTRHRAYRALVAELRRLPDLQLEDLGLDRTTFAPDARAAIYGA